MKTKVNFRATVFRGSLRKLFEECSEALDDANAFTSAHQWLRLQLHHTTNILPVRKFAQHSLRGILFPMGKPKFSFMPCDNEPLADLYWRWTKGREIAGTIGQALTDGELVASWKSDEVPVLASRMKFRGVKTPFRDRGLKLAHIADAAREITGDTTLPEQIAIRFLRTLSPFNVFLFPSRRCCELRLISSTSGWHPKSIDWAEDLEVRRLALAWLIGSIGTPVRDAFLDFESGIKPLGNGRLLLTEPSSKCDQEV